MMQLSRRGFGKFAALAAAGHLAGMGPFGNMAALAQSNSASDYRALVCVYLGGGNDSNNMIVPLTPHDYAAYASVRGSLALDPSSLVPLSGTSYGLHGSMLGLANLFAAKKTAVLANVGTLVKPLTAAQFQAGSVPAPSSLFSHADQSAIWQNGFTDGSMAAGWGGRIADALQTSSGDLPMVVSVAGSSVFTSGQLTSPVVLQPYVSPMPSCTDGPAVCAARTAGTQQMMKLSSGLVWCRRTAPSRAMRCSTPPRWRAL